MFIMSLTNSRIGGERLSQREREREREGERERESIWKSDKRKEKEN